MSNRNIETQWDGIRLQPIAYSLYKFATEAYENNYDNTKVNTSLSRLLGSSNYEGQSSQGKTTTYFPKESDKHQKFKVEQIIDRYKIGDFISFTTIDKHKHSGEILQIDEHSIVITNREGTQFFYEGYIKAIQYNADDHKKSSKAKRTTWHNQLNTFIKSQIERENPQYPFSDEVLMHLAEKQLGVNLDISEVSTIRETLGYKPYLGRRTNQSTTNNMKGGVNDVLSFEDLPILYNSSSAFWDDTISGFDNGIYTFVDPNGGFAKQTGEAYLFKSYSYTVFVNELCFAKNISNSKKHNVWCNKLRLFDEISLRASTNIAVEYGTIREIQASYYYYFIRASFGACLSILEYLNACGVNVKPLKLQINKAKKSLLNNSKNLSRKYPEKNIYISALSKPDRNIVIDFTHRILSCCTTSPISPCELWNVLYESFGIRFTKGNVGGIIDTSKDVGRNIYNLRVSTSTSIDGIVGEILNLVGKLMDLNYISEDSLLPTNAKITHFNGCVYTIQEDISCQISKVSKRIMVGKPSAEHIYIVTAPNGKILSATSFATYGEILSYFRTALIDGPYYEFYQTFILLVRTFVEKGDIPSRIKSNLKRLLELRGLQEENEYERTSFSEMDDAMRNSLIAFVKFILESDGGFEITNGEIRTQFEKSNEIFIDKGAIQEAKNIVFENNPELSESYRRFLAEHNDQNK